MCRYHSIARDSATNSSEDSPVNPPFKIENAQEFAKAVLESVEFREYILAGLKSQKLPAAIVLRLMDYAEGWGRPPERIEHTGRDGDAIITEIREVIIHAQPEQQPQVPQQIIGETLEMDDDLDTPMLPTPPRRMH